MADEGVARLFAFVGATVKQRVTGVFTRVPTVQGLHLLVHMARDVLFGLSTETFGRSGFHTHRTKARMTFPRTRVFSTRHGFAANDLAAPALVGSQYTGPLASGSATGTGQNGSHGRTFHMGTWMAC